MKDAKEGSETNMSLKEKDIEEHPYVKWLEKKLEDVQKEIDKLKHFEDLYIKNIRRLENKHLELKQKLENFDVVDFLERHKGKYDEWLKSQFFHLIEELLKEE